MKAIEVKYGYSPRVDTRNSILFARVEGDEQNETALFEQDHYPYCARVHGELVHVVLDAAELAAAFGRAARVRRHFAKKQDPRTTRAWIKMAMSGDVYQYHTPAEKHEAERAAAAAGYHCTGAAIDGRGRERLTFDRGGDVFRLEWARLESVGGAANLIAERAAARTNRMTFIGGAR